MTATRIGILHPGEMGAALAELARDSGHETHWVAAGRSDSTRARAQAAGLREVATLEELCAHCDAIVSVCPPHAARAVAAEVAAQGFRGLYVDANAVAPQTVHRIADLMREAGARFADAAIVGPPPRPATHTRLLVSGDAAEEAARLLAGPGLMPLLLGPEAGRASAVKMCHSAMHKGMLALQFAVFAAAEECGLRAELERLWAERADTAGYADLQGKLQRAAKSWRFAGEMDEVAATLASAGLPAGFHEAAAEVYRRLAEPAAAGPMDAPALARALVGPRRPADGSR